MMHFRGHDGRRGCLVNDEDCGLPQSSGSKKWDQPYLGALIGACLLQRGANIRKNASELAKQRSSMLAYYGPYRVTLSLHPSFLPIPSAFFLHAVKPFQNRPHSCGLTKTINSYFRHKSITAKHWSTYYKEPSHLPPERKITFSCKFPVWVENGGYYYNGGPLLAHALPAFVAL